MSEEMSPIEVLEYNLQWIWPSSFEKLEAQPDGTAVATFQQSYSYWNRWHRRKVIWYSVLITFHRHENQWRYGKIRISKPSLFADVKNETRQRFQTILENWGYRPEKRSQYAG